MARVDKESLKVYEQYLRSQIIKNPDMKDTTYKVYRSSFNIFLCFLLEEQDNIYVLSDDFTENAIDIMENFQYFMQTELGNGKKAANTKTSAVSSFYIWAVRRKLLSHHPFSELERMANSKDEKLLTEHYLTEEEVQKITTELDKVIEPDYKGPYDRLDRVLWYIAYVSANRIGALSKLTVSSYDREKMVFTNIREKRAKMVSVGLLDYNMDVIAVIDDYLEYRESIGVDCDGFFYVRYDGEWRAMNSGSLSLRIKKIGQILEIDDFRPHSIRKSRANEIRDKHGIESAQLLLNHESAETTQAHYVKKKDASDVLSRIAELEKERHDKQNKQ